jgi:hypothetical protein
LASQSGIFLQDFRFCFAVQKYNFFQYCKQF